MIGQAGLPAQIRADRPASATLRRQRRQQASMGVDGGRWGASIREVPALVRKPIKGKPPPTPRVVKPLILRTKLPTKLTTRWGCGRPRSMRPLRTPVTSRLRAGSINPARIARYLTLSPYPAIISLMVVMSGYMHRFVGLCLAAHLVSGREEEDDDRAR